MPRLTFWRAGKFLADYVNTDRRIERHPYSVEELGLLLAAAESGSLVHGMTGAGRVLLYRTAAETGFRWSECHRLTRASFDFASEPATVSIKARDAKNENADICTIPSKVRTGRGTVTQATSTDK